MFNFRSWIAILRKAQRRAPYVNRRPKFARLGFDVLEDRIVPTITANTDVYLVPTNGPYSGSSVLANDTNSTNSTMSASLRSPLPSHGTVFLNPNGTFVYTPTAGYTGQDQFVYQAWAIDAPNDPSAFATVYLIVGNIPAPPPGGGNRAPIVAPIGARSDIEGRLISVQVVAADPDGNPITYSAQQLPAGLTINQNSGVISGKITYTSSGTYNATVTVTDNAGAATTIGFVWNVADATIATLTGTELNAGTPGPNSVLVTAISITTIYLSPGNTLRLGVLAPLPLGADVLFSIVGSGATPASGNFGGAAPNISFSGVSNLYFVGAGIDINGNATLESAEITQGFYLSVISFLGAVVGSQRTSGGPVEPALTLIQASEHFEVGGFFKFEIMGGIAGPSSMIRYEVWQSEWPNILLRSGQGNSFTDSFGPVNAPWSCFVRFYDDANNSGTYNWGELYIESPWFKVVQPRVFNINVAVSAAVGGGLAAATAFAAWPAMQARFDLARDLLVRKDSATDWRAAVQFNVNILNLSVFVPTNSAGAAPDPANSFSDRVKHYNNLAADVVFLNVLNLRGSTWHNNWHQIIIGYTDCDNGLEASLAKTLAHEIGHGVGLYPVGHPTDTRLIMTQGWGAGAYNELEGFSDAEKYATGTPSVVKTFPQQDAADDHEDEQQSAAPSRRVPPGLWAFANTAANDWNVIRLAFVAIPLRPVWLAGNGIRTDNDAGGHRSLTYASPREDSQFVFEDVWRHRPYPDPFKKHDPAADLFCASRLLDALEDDPWNT